MNRYFKIRRMVSTGKCHIDRFLHLKDIGLMETKNAVFITNYSNKKFEGMTLE